ncbi:MAG: winged helix-turn-helix transcriptional regulator [Candidatus Nanohaloarchaea archaeon]
MSKKEDKIPVWCKTEEWCALKSTSKILGHKWVPVITYHIYENEEIRFSAIKEEVGGITNKTLSNNLDRMEEQGIINRNVEDDKPVKIRYELTEFGERLIPLVEEMISWGQENLKEGEREDASIT